MRRDTNWLGRRPVASDGHHDFEGPVGGFDVAAHAAHGRGDGVHTGHDDVHALAFGDGADVVVAHLGPDVHLFQIEDPGDGTRRGGELALLGEDAVHRAAEGGGDAPEVYLLIEGGDALLEGLHVGPGFEQLNFGADFLGPEALLTGEDVPGEAEAGLQFIQVAGDDVVFELNQDLALADGFPFGHTETLHGALSHGEDLGHSVGFHVALHGEEMVEWRRVHGEGGHLSGVGRGGPLDGSGRVAGLGAVGSTAGSEEEGGNRQEGKGADHGIRRSGIVGDGGGR